MLTHNLDKLSMNLGLIHRDEVFDDYLPFRISYWLVLVPREYLKKIYTYFS